MLSDLTWIDWLGILGSLMIAGAYLAVSRAWVDGTRPAFHFINLGGAVLILFSLWFRPNAGAILIEVLWIFIAVTSLWRYWRRRG